MSPHPAGQPLRKVQMVALAIVILAGWGICPAGSMGADPPREVVLPAQVHLETSRRVGLAPMDLEVSGVVRDAQHREVPLDGNHRVTLEVNSSFFRLVSSGQEIVVVAGGSAEFEANVQHPDPMKRNLVIHRPGTYTFRWLIEDADGNRILSNPVQVRVL